MGCRLTQIYRIKKGNIQKSSYQNTPDHPKPLEFVILGLTRNPVFSWMPAFNRTATFAWINVVEDSFLKEGFFVAGFEKCEYGKS
jgi:hypothetical protein